MRVSVPSTRARGARVGRRRTAALTTSLAVLATTVLTATGAALTSPSASAAPAEDCTQAYPQDQLAADDPVTGLTVTRGATPTGFDGQILGVLQDGIAPGVDMILARLTSPEIDRVGIWQGMSGSPVYASDGRLIGAVAYGLAYGASPVAGITPYAEMDDYLGDASPRTTVKVGPKTARAIASSTDDVSARQAAQGLTQLPMPVGVSGVSADRLAKAERKAGRRDYLKGNLVASGAGGSASRATQDDIVAGGNIAAAATYGDVNIAGVGTATSVCNGRVVGFGHPFSFTGDTSLSLHPADAIYIQEDPLGPGFKVANLSGPVGTITDDRLTGITGGFGAIPRATSVTSTVSYAGRTREGTTSSNLADYNADATFLELLGNHDRVIDGVTGGTERQTWTITGTDADDAPFALTYVDRYTTPFDIAFQSVFDIADVVYGISRQPGVNVDTVNVGSQITDNEDVLTVSSVEQRRRGSWNEIGRRRAAVATSGGTINLRVTLADPSGAETRTRLQVKVPRRSSGNDGYLSVAGGASTYSNAAYAKSLDAILDGVRKQARNDEVVATLDLFTRGGGNAASDKSSPQDLVVKGRRSARVAIR